MGIVAYPQYFRVYSRDDADELRRLSDGHRVTMLEGSVKKLEFPDEAYFIVHRDDGAPELRPLFRLPIARHTARISSADRLAPGLSRFTGLDFG